MNWKKALSVSLMIAASGCASYSPPDANHSPSQAAPPATVPPHPALELQQCGFFGFVSTADTASVQAILPEGYVAQPYLDSPRPETNQTLVELNGADCREGRYDSQRYQNILLVWPAFQISKARGKLVGDDANFYLPELFIDEPTGTLLPLLSQYGWPASDGRIAVTSSAFQMENATMYYRVTTRAEDPVAYCTVLHSKDRLHYLTKLDRPIWMDLVLTHTPQDTLPGPCGDLGLSEASGGAMQKLTTAGDNFGNLPCLSCAYLHADFDLRMNGTASAPA
jgi:hypothetical protein